MLALPFPALGGLWGGICFIQVACVGCGQVFFVVFPVSMWAPVLKCDARGDQQPPPNIRLQQAKDDTTNNGAYLSPAQVSHPLFSQG